MRVAAHPHADQLDQRRALAGARAFGRPGERGGDRVRIGAVDRDARDAVAGRLVGEHAHRRLLAHRRRERRLVVLHAEDRGQPARGAQVDRLVPLAERRSPFADERDRDAPAPSRANAIAMPAIVSAPIASGAAAGRTPHVEVADVQVLAVHRRPGLAHLRREHHAHRLRRRGASRAPTPRSRMSGAITSPLPAVRRRDSAVAAAQPDGRRVDRFLAERAEALALKRRVAVPHFAAREERLQPVVGRARQRHAAQNLAALVAR